MGFNYNETTLQKVIELPAVVQNVSYPQVSFLNKTAASALTTANPKEKVILQANWSLDRFSVNLRETVYGPAAQWSADNSYYEKINTTAITDLDVAYKFSKHLKLDVGANNLFDTLPPHPPNPADKPVGGGRVYNVPYAFAAWGGNGGYYYGRFTYTF